MHLVKWLPLRPIYFFSKRNFSQNQQCTLSVTNLPKIAVVRDFTVIGCQGSRTAADKVDSSAKKFFSSELPWSLYEFGYKDWAGLGGTTTTVRSGRAIPKQKLIKCHTPRRLSAVRADRWSEVASDGSGTAVLGVAWVSALWQQSAESASERAAP
ncbi:hypothetical protein J6590_021622 [Homalodisca vitripennis]|nr:hypothetical protein J6590_021622 [Homalodisca vitripennis]